MSLFELNNEFLGLNWGSNVEETQTESDFNIYDRTAIEALVENGEITYEEEAFMRGYLEEMEEE